LSCLLSYIASTASQFRSIPNIQLEEAIVMCNRQEENSIFLLDHFQNITRRI